MSDTSSPSKNQSPWRKVLPIHPAAELLPRPTPDDFAKLVADIKANGQVLPVIIYQGQLLDGISRLDAMIEAGIEVVKNGKIVAKQQDITDEKDETFDPFEFAASINVHRRHLTFDKRKAFARNLLKDNPNRSDRLIASMAGIDNKTVAAARAYLERCEEIPHTETRKDKGGRDQPAAKPKPKKVTEPSPAEPPAPAEPVEASTSIEPPAPITVTSGNGASPQQQAEGRKIYYCEANDAQKAQVLAEFFATAGGSEILKHIPADRRSKVIHELLNAYGHNGVREAMPLEILTALSKPKSNGKSKSSKDEKHENAFREAAGETKH